MGYLQKGWNWLLWWRVDRHAVQWQAEHYDELTLGGSFKGLSVLFIVANALLFSLPALINRDPAAAFFEPAALLLLAGFVYLGHRWAMIGAMLVWSLERAAQIADAPNLILIIIPWWAVVMHAFYMALLVERRRADPKAEMNLLEQQLGIVLRWTGRMLEIAAVEIWTGLRLAIRKARR